MAETIFSKIIRGEIPCHRVYDDEHVLAFLDIGPLSRGHTLLIPRERAARLDELSPAAASALGRVLPRLARAVMAVTGAEGFNVFQTNGACSGQQVPHVHYHVIPRAPEDGLGFRWKTGSYPEGHMADWQSKIAAALER